MAVDPFRDAGTAALARNDELERENARLREALQVRTALAAAPDRAFVQGVLIACILVLAALCFMAFLVHHWR
jgi:hypothetical protein